MNDPVTGLPTPGPLGRASGTSVNSLSQMPTQRDNVVRATERLTPAQMKTLAAELSHKANAFVARTKAIEQSVAEKTAAVKTQFSGRSDLPQTTRDSLARTISKPYRQEALAASDAERAASLKEIHDLSARLEAQSNLYRSSNRLALDVAMSQQAQPFLGIAANAGMAMVLSMFESAMAENSQVKAALGLVAWNNLSESDRRAIKQKGWSPEIVNDRVFGAELKLARDAIDSAIVSRRTAALIERELVTGVPDAQERIAIQLHIAGHRGG